jgi:hypothetical protein
VSLLRIGASTQLISAHNPIPEAHNAQPIPFALFAETNLSYHHVFRTLLCE